MRCLCVSVWSYICGRLGLYVQGHTGLCLRGEERVLILLHFLKGCTGVHQSASFWPFCAQPGPSLPFLSHLTIARTSLRPKKSTSSPRWPPQTPPTPNCYKQDAPSTPPGEVFQAHPTERRSQGISRICWRIIYIPFGHRKIWDTPSRAWRM